MRVDHLRVTLFIFGLVGAIFIHWSVPLVVILALSIRYRAWEALVLGLGVDLLWQTPASSFMNLPSWLPLFTLFAIAVVWLCEPLRVEFLR